MSDDALDQLQNPQEATSQPADNMALINQFNHADSAKRNIANGFASGQLADYDEKINRLHGIDARLITNEVAPLDKLSPDIVKQARLLFSQGMFDPAREMLSEENRKQISRNQYGGAMSPEEWDSVRDYAGRKSAAHANAPQAMQGPIGNMPPMSKEAMYSMGIDAFDRAFAKHKKYLVEYPKQALQAPVMAPHRAAVVPPEASPILQLMRQAGTIGQQQEAGAPAMAPDEFAAAIGVRK